MSACPTTGVPVKFCTCVMCGKPAAIETPEVVAPELCLVMTADGGPIPRCEDYPQCKCGGPEGWP